jgi:hypothetical protein
VIDNNFEEEDLLNSRPPIIDLIDWKNRNKDG